MTKPIGAIVLAAGFSTRFGSSKLLAAMNDGRAVFQQTIERIEQAFSTRLVITRPDLLDHLQALAPDTTVLGFDGAGRGMGATLAFAVQQTGDWGGCVVCLGDMPFVTPSTYRLVSEQLAQASIVIPTLGSKVGNPVAFSHIHFDELAMLDGDSGGRRIIQRHEDAVLRLPVDDPGILQDIDTEAELTSYQQT